MFDCVYGDNFSGYDIVQSVSAFHIKKQLVHLTSSSTAHLQDGHGPSRVNMYVPFMRGFIPHIDCLVIPAIRVAAGISSHDFIFTRVVHPVS